LFAAGLGVSGMTQPTRVVGFLDFFGNWDPTLMFVMIGAMSMYFVFYRVVRGTAPVLARDYHLPTGSRIDARLLVGAGLFGVGWGLAGFCPGPALVSLATGTAKVATFVAAMVAGMYGFAAVESLSRPRRRGR
jgi:uncharacterized protein